MKMWYNGYTSFAALLGVKEIFLYYNAVYSIILVFVGVECKEKSISQAPKFSLDRGPLGRYLYAAPK